MQGQVIHHISRMIHEIDLSLDDNYKWASNTV